MSNNSNPNNPQAELMPVGQNANAELRASENSTSSNAQGALAQASCSAAACSDNLDKACLLIANQKNGSLNIMSTVDKIQYNITKENILTAFGVNETFRPRVASLSRLTSGN